MTPYQTSPEETPSSEGAPSPPPAGENAGKSNTADFHLEVARYLQKQGNYAAAKEKYQAALNLLDPASPKYQQVQEQLSRVGTHQPDEDENNRPAFLSDSWGKTKKEPRDNSALIKYWNSLRKIPRRTVNITLIIIGVILLSMLAWQLYVLAYNYYPDRFYETMQPVEVRTQISAVDNVEMVYVPEGEFLMGSRPYDYDAVEDETPQHSVYLDAFWIDRTEVTNAMFARFLNEVGNQIEGQAYWFDDDPDFARIHQSADGSWVPVEGYEDKPVIEVTWYGANAYCQWAERRLPTEAEWEKAARGTDARNYPWGNEDPAVNLLSYHRTIKDTLPVGCCPDGASPYGAYDMAGNVWEWVADWYDPQYYENTPYENPSGPESGYAKVLRGGSWGSLDLEVRRLELLSPHHRIRTAAREPVVPNGTFHTYGFRCADSD